MPALETWVSGRSRCEFMHDMYIAEIYRPRAMLLLLPVWVYLRYILYSEPQKSYIGKVVRYGRSRSFKVIDIGNKLPIQSPYATFYYS